MHSKQKGALGEVAVIKDLLRRDYQVFKEIGDLSKVDLIVLVDHVPVKIQVKALVSKHGIVEVNSKKSGPGYSFRYGELDVDIFAVYIIDKDEIFYVSAKEILNNKTTSKFRIVKPINNQLSGIRWVKDYQEFKNALRDYTPSTLPALLEGDDIVQTTTERSG